jgi:hypothetical protein
MDGNTFAFYFGGTTMNEQVANETSLPATKMPMRTGASVAPIVPRTYEEAWRIANHYVKTGMAPRDMKTPERVMIALMAGMEVGLPPIAALNGIAIINNRPRIWGAAVPALAINTGQLVAWDEIIEGEGETMVARCLIARRVSADLVIRKETTFSVADARQAGLWDERAAVDRWMTNYQTNQKEKKTVPNDSPWYRYRKRMMTMRARQVFTDLFADVFCGLGIAEVYVGPDSDAEMRDVTPPAQPVIHNPLQDDAEVSTAIGNEAETEVMPPEQIPQRNVSETSPPGATGGGHLRAPAGTKILDGNEAVAALLEAEPDDGAVVHVDGTVTRPGDWNHPTESEVRNMTMVNQPEPVEPPRQARRETAGEPKPEPAPRQPEPEKASPGPNPALAIALEQPWIKKSVADYILYLERWVEAWAKWGQDPLGLRDRFSAERTIRNGLAEKMTDKQLAQCKATAAGAFARLGGVPK